MGFGTEFILVIAGFVFNILFWGGLIYVVIKLANRKPKNLKKCQFCAELIQPEAIVCHWCKRDLVK